MSTYGIDLIDAERQRQVEQEGWTHEHDDRHNDGAIVRAAHCYAYVGRVQLGRPPMPTVSSPGSWPWAAQWWKPSDSPIRNLVKAGALYQAAIDRAMRKGDGFVMLLALRDRCAADIDRSTAHA